MANAASVLQPAGPVAAAIAEVGVVLIVGAALIFIGTMGLLGWAVWRRKHDADRSHAMRWVVGGGIAFPTVVLSALLAYATLRSGPLNPPHDTEGLTISVTARMWWWEVRYTDPASGREVLLANEIHLPVGRPVTLGLGSADVIHSFWVPALAGKIDMVPGKTHQLRLSADRAGVFRGPCAEYCGEQHARMVLHVVAQPAQEFDRWLAAQAQNAAPPSDTLAQRGQALFVAQRCNACHAVRGLVDGAGLGPDLTHVGSRLFLGAGTLANHRATLAQWIADTQGVKPGARMPSSGELDAASLQALAAFLEGLR